MLNTEKIVYPLLNWAIKMAFSASLLVLTSLVIPGYIERHYKTIKWEETESIVFFVIKLEKKLDGIGHIDKPSTD